jgi:hypothetical protein
VSGIGFVYHKAITTKSAGMKGRPMKRECIADKEADAGRSEVASEKCSFCNQSFKSSADLVRNGKDRLCTSCYQGLLDPFPRLCCDGAAF